MRKYEIMYILRANLDDEARKAEIEKLSEILADCGAKVKESKELGIKDFAYDIAGEKKGYYVDLKIDAEPGSLDEFVRLAKLDRNVIRHLIVVDE